MSNGRLWVLGAAALWSVGGLLIRYANQRHGVAPEAMACLRSAFAGIALAWAVPAARPAFGRRFALAAMFYVGILFAFVKATVVTTSAHAIFIQYLYPLLVAVGARLLYGERIGPRGAVALALGAAGIGVILSGARLEPAGLAVALASAGCFAGFVLTQRGVTEGSPVGIASALNLITAAALLPVAWPHLRISAAGWGVIAFTGVVQLGIPYVMFLRGLRMIPATEAAILTLLEPVLNPVWVLLLAEVPDAHTIAGGVLILVAVGVRMRGRREPKA